MNASCQVLDCANIYAMSFDSLSWMVLAEMHRRRYNGPPPLRIKFANVDKIAEARKKQWPNEDTREWWIDRVLRPCLPLIGAIEDDAIERGPFQAPFDSPEHVHKAIADAALIYEVPRLTAGDDVEKHGKVTITLRECEHWKHRNSNLDAWCKFAGYLEDKGESVVIVRDTSKAAESFDGFDTCPEASLDIQARMRLYEGAKMNFFVSNGPMMLAVFSKIPFVSFQTQFAGMHGSLQWAWLVKNQRVLLERDNYDNLVKVWGGKL